MIQSFSDIITNSSSEVFGWDVNDLMTFESVEKDGKVEGWDSTYKAGNLLIWSNGDNSIPSSIMDIISEMEWGIPALEDIVIFDITREHL